MIFNIFSCRLSLRLASVFTIFVIFLSAIGTPASINGQTNYDKAIIEPTISNVQAFEDCFNGLDDDGDGFFDSDDADCASTTPAFEDCFNGLDDDGDGFFDSDDADCPAVTEPEPQQEPQQEEIIPEPVLPPEECGDNIDNNGDGQTDEGCPAQSPPEETESIPAEEICGDGVDNTGDGQIDETCPTAQPETLPKEQIAPKLNETPPTALLEVPPKLNETPPTAPLEVPPKLNETPPQGPEVPLPVERKTTLQCFTTTINNTVCTRNEEEEPTTVEQNQPPVANAGEDQKVNGDSMVNLDATQTNDPDGNIASYFWSQSGEPTVTIVDADTAKPSFIAPLWPSSIDLKFDLTVVDDKGAYDVDSVNISVNGSEITEEPIKNISIELNPVPEKIFINDTYEFTGTLNGIDNASGRYIEIKDDDGTEKGNTIAFDDADGNGNFAVDWYPGPEKESYKVFASYEDQHGNIVKSVTYDLIIDMSTFVFDDTNLTGIVEPYIKISKIPWTQRALNVYVAAVDDYSRRFLDTVQSGVDELEDVLKEKTGNYQSWNFRKIESETVFKNPKVLSTYPPNIMILIQEKKNCADRTLGLAADTWLFGDITKFRYLILIFAGCHNPSNEADWVYWTTIHEMLHGLGLGHTWNEEGDLLCSSDTDDYGNHVENTCANASNNYNDNSAPSEFNIRAIIDAYGNNGFELPNKGLQRGINDNYFCGKPFPCERRAAFVDTGKIAGAKVQAQKPIDIEKKKIVTTGNADSSKLAETKNIELSSKSYSFTSSWGASGAQNGQFDHPSDIAVDTSENAIYVTDINNARIQKFTDKGEFLTTWGQKGIKNGSFDQPADVAFDDGFVYVSDINNNRIQKFDTDGKFIKSWGSFGTNNGQFDHPGAIAVDTSEGILYVVDIGNHRVQKFTTNGTHLDSWGTKGTANGQLDRPAGLAFDSATNRVFVVDTGNNRIQVFDKNGTYIDKWGSTGTGDGQFNRPTDVTADAENKLAYVADNENFRIQVFDNNGNFISKWGTKGEGKGQFLEPTGVTVNPAKNLVYVVDKQGNEISMFSTSPVSAATLGGNATEYPECFSGTNPPPCILSDGTTAYSCDDPRHLKSDLEQCIYWNKSTGGYDLRMNLASPNHKSKNNNDDGGYACRFSDAKVVKSNKDLPVCNEKRLHNNNNNDNDNKKDNSDEYICDSDPSTSAPSCDKLLKEQEKENDNNDNDKEEKPDFGPPDEDFEVQGNLSG